LPDAVSLNSAGFNLARALGPALGGLAVAAFAHADTGAAWTFLLNALSFVGVILVLYQWKRKPLFKSALPAERIYGSMRAGLRYIQYAPPLKAALARAFIFTLFVSAVWSLLAVVAARDLHQGALGYGILNGSMGLGAVIGATSLPRVRRKFSADAIIAISTGVIHRDAAHPGLRPISAGHHSRAADGRFRVDQHHVHAQSGGAGLRAAAGCRPARSGPTRWSFPEAWRWAASSGDCLPSTSRRRSARHRRRRPAHHLPLSLAPARAAGRTARPPPVPDQAPASRNLVMEPEMSDGPVRILIDYYIDPEDYNDFVHAIHELRDVRMRDGAMRWGIFQDADDPRHSTRPS
jgi:hypothetical protein